jgi:predicted house-cleaning noncanonical NTP pyrophosphatase (MazG superfamily)
MIKKLVRIETVKLFKEGESEIITDKKELNKLYALKIKEELSEIQHSDHKDIMEFVDLIEVAYCFAEQNGFNRQDIDLHKIGKKERKGIFTNIALNNLNPDNPSNDIYFEKEAIDNITAKSLLNLCIEEVVPDSYQSEKQLDTLKYEASIKVINHLINKLRNLF